MQDLAQITRAAELRDSPAERRADGSFYTDADVARHLARRAVGAWLLEHAARVDPHTLASWLADGRDCIDALVQLATTDAARDAVRTRIATVTVLDPSCGAGSFLHAAWDALVEVETRLELGPVIDGEQICGVDIDPGAAQACQLALAAHVPAARGAVRVLVADAQQAAMLPAADIVLGNPPYVRAALSEAPADLATRAVPNRSAWIVERALDAARPAARVTFVLPISTVCTDAFAPARSTWSARCSTVHACHFDTIPSTLFVGVVQRLSIIEGRVRTADGAGDAGDATWWTSRYHRWRRDERDGLLARVRHVELPPQQVGGSLAKIGTDIEAGLLDRLFTHPPAQRLLNGAQATDNRVWYKRRWSYFLLFTDFVPPMWDADGVPREPSEFKALDVVASFDARALLAIYSSTLFWWYFSVFTDNRNVNRRDLVAFPVPELDASRQRELAALSAELMVALRACAEVRTCTYRSIGTIRNTYFRQGATRPVIDRIDHALAQAVGMTDEQLAFVLGFERRFRGGEQDVARQA